MHRAAVEDTTEQFFPFRDSELEQVFVICRLLRWTVFPINLVLLKVLLSVQAFLLTYHVKRVRQDAAMYACSSRWFQSVVCMSDVWSGNMYV